jgi:hypothetical protein
MRGSARHSFKLRKFERSCASSSVRGIPDALRDFAKTQIAQLEKVIGHGAWSRRVDEQE